MKLDHRAVTEAIYSTGDLDLSPINPKINKVYPVCEDERRKRMMKGRRRKRNMRNRREGTMEGVKKENRRRKRVVWLEERRE